MGFWDLFSAATSEDCNPAVKAGLHRDTWFATKFDFSPYLQTLQKTRPRARFCKAKKWRRLGTRVSCDACGARRNSGPRQRPIDCAVFGSWFIIELELVAVCPWIWEPCLPVPLAESVSLEGVQIFVMLCSSWQIMGYMCIAKLCINLDLGLDFGTWKLFTIKSCRALRTILVTAFSKGYSLTLCQLFLQLWARKASEGKALGWEFWKQGLDKHLFIYERVFKSSSTVTKTLAVTEL